MKVFRGKWDRVDRVQKEANTSEGLQNWWHRGVHKCLEKDEGGECDWTGRLAQRVKAVVSHTQTGEERNEGNHWWCWERGQWNAEKEPGHHTVKIPKRSPRSRKGGD